jgi:hypothetical protein
LQPEARSFSVGLWGPAGRSERIHRALKWWNAHLVSCQPISVKRGVTRRDPILSTPEREYESWKLAAAKLAVACFSIVDAVRIANIPEAPKQLDAPPAHG